MSGQFRVGDRVKVIAPLVSKNYGKMGTAVGLRRSGDWLVKADDGDGFWMVSGDYNEQAPFSPERLMRVSRNTILRGVV